MVIFDCCILVLEGSNLSEKKMGKIVMLILMAMSQSMRNTAPSCVLPGMPWVVLLVGDLCNVFCGSVFSTRTHITGCMGSICTVI